MKLNINTRIYVAKKFLNENFNELMITIARIFQFFRNFFKNFIIRKNDRAFEQNEKQNLILKFHQTQAVHDFIR